ncbi:MAG: pilus assembly protein TadG-related protein [Chloroflexi bacterium]|nr:pilus assembly protein TadG-related protein [Chloroflexota bacterium]
MIKKNNQEKGQILVLVVVGLVALIGFVALAIDGGMTLSDRRNDQNGADAAALAGAWATAQYLEEHHVLIEEFNCGNAEVINAINAAYPAAKARATSNGFTIETGLSEKNGVQVSCTSSSDKYITVKVMITTTTQTSFMQLVNGGTVQNTVEATAQVNPKAPVGGGYAIASLSPYCDKPNSANQDFTYDGGIFFSGLGGQNPAINVYGGGIHSNSCMRSNGNIWVKVYDQSGAIAASGAIDYYQQGGLDTNGNDSLIPPIFQPWPIHTDRFIEPYDVEHPQCGADQDVNTRNGGTIEPGTYRASGHQGDAINVQHGTLIMKPGLYCLYGNFTASAGATVQIEGYPPGSSIPDEHAGVTLYMPEGDFEEAGGAEIHLMASTYATPTNNEIPGMLIYMPASNRGFINLGGNPENNFNGTIYAPTAYIDLGGDPANLSTKGLELVGYVIVIHGSSTITMPYQGDQLYHKPTTMSLIK